MSNDELQLRDGRAHQDEGRQRAIAVSAEEGVVTLRGTVGNLREEARAKDAERVHGVKHVRSSST
jgi:osmotically-inducible protein OsmY